MTTVTRIAEGTYSADPIHSSFQAGVSHMGVGSFRTTFSDVSARLTAAGGGELSVEGRAQVASISIANPPEFREHVVDGAEFFDAGNHPEIVLRSTRLELADDGSAQLDGELVIKGIAKPVTASGTWREPIQDLGGGVRMALDLQAVVDRRDWDITWQAPLPGGGDALGWAVEIEAHLELVKDAV
ncbi:MAG TPA: YceI family protein [Solirubrobacteraceae bacterium]|nr:YceI family protein [Solirubrobacteraceae bacterium]